MTVHSYPLMNTFTLAGLVPNFSPLTTMSLPWWVEKEGEMSVTLGVFMVPL